VSQKQSGKRERKRISQIQFAFLFPPSFYRHHHHHLLHSCSMSGANQISLCFFSCTRGMCVDVMMTFSPPLMQSVAKTTQKHHNKSGEVCRQDTPGDSRRNHLPITHNECYVVDYLLHIFPYAYLDAECLSLSLSLP
jgi:hypothetical protein